MYQLGIIGTGNMGGAILKGTLNKGSIAGNEIIAADRNQTQFDTFRQQNVVCTQDNTAACDTRFLLLAVKPQVLPAVCREIAPYLKKETVVISIAAGYTLSMLSQLLSENVKLVRAMPNTPAMVGKGITAVCPGENVLKEEMDGVLDILSAAGQTEIVSENLFDAVVGVSGSAPAYVFLFIEALADAGVARGMTRKQAMNFAANAVYGSAALMLETGKHPAELKDMVCSPAGTTIDAVLKLEEKGFRSAVAQAALTAADKNAAMGSH